jgi:hypothetical protein
MIPEWQSLILVRQVQIGWGRRSGGEDGGTKEWDRHLQSFIIDSIIFSTYNRFKQLGAQNTSHHHPRQTIHFHQ